MDREQEEMQFLGIFGIYKESYKIILSWRKIFSQITVTLILPLCFISLAHIEVSDILLSKIIRNEMILDKTWPDSPKYKKVSDFVSFEWTTFWLFRAVYLILYLIFSLLYTSAVVYAIACIYAGREVTFKKVMRVVPKVWKRLIVTLMCIFVAGFVYSLVVGLVIAVCVITVGQNDKVVVPFIVIGILNLVGFVYISIVWQLASVVSVLEEAYGVRAILKSKALIKGKMWVAIIIFLKLNFSYIIIHIAFQLLVVEGQSLSIFSRVAYGILCFILLFMLMVFELVIRTVIYFVCKSYHHENIDKSALSDHLEVYLGGEYVPLKTSDVQLEQYKV